MRPEDLTPTDGPGLFTARVEYTEALGEVTLLYFEATDGANPLVAKLPGIHTGLRGQTMTVTADPSKVHLFANGQSLRS